VAFLVEELQMPPVEELQTLPALLLLP
jgi:hypothetical protein